MCNTLYSVLIQNEIEIFCFEKGKYVNSTNSLVVINTQY